MSRREYWADVHAADDAKAEERRRAEAVWAEHQVILDRLAAEARAPKPVPEPRIWRL